MFSFVEDYLRVTGKPAILLTADEYVKLASLEIENSRYLQYPSLATKDTLSVLKAGNEHVENSMQSETIAVEKSNAEPAKKKEQGTAANSVQNKSEEKKPEPLKKSNKADILSLMKSISG